MDYKRLRDILEKKGIRIKDGRIHKKDAAAIAKIIHSENEWEKKFRENDGAPKDMVAKAEKASKEGHWLERYTKISDIVGSRWAEDIGMLQDVQEKFGSQPEGLKVLADELMSSIVFELVDNDGWNKADLERIAWGLPGYVNQMYKLDRPSGTPKEREDIA